MKEIPFELKKKGLNYKRFAVSEKAYIYQVLPNGGYDVFIRKQSPASCQVINGQMINYEESEMWPSDNAFGQWAWHFVTVEKANRKFTELSK